MELWPVVIQITYFRPQHWVDRQTDLPNVLPTSPSLDHCCYLGKMFIHLLPKEDVNRSVCNVCTHVQYSPNSSSSFLSQYGHRCLVLLCLSKAWTFVLKLNLNIWWWWKSKYATLVPYTPHQSLPSPQSNLTYGYLGPAQQHLPLSVRLPPFFSAYHIGWSHSFSVALTLVLSVSPPLTSYYRLSSQLLD